MRRALLLATALFVLAAVPAAAGTPSTIGEGKDPHVILGDDGDNRTMHRPIDNPLTTEPSAPRGERR